MSVKKKIGIEETTKIDFSNRDCTSVEKKPSDGSFGEAEYKSKNITDFNILNNLL